MEINENENGYEETKPTNTKTTKDELIDTIRDWIKIDSDILKLKADTKEKLKRKQELTEKLTNVMKTNAIDCFDIKGGSLIYKTKKSKKPITGKFLLLQLENYYKDNPLLAKEITQKVLENREEVIKEEIKRKINK